MTERTSYGTPAFFADKKLMARFLEDHETLALKMTFEERDIRLEVMPDLFFLTPHYQDYEMVLLHAEQAPAVLLEEVLETAWRLAATKKRAKALDESRA